MTLNPAKASPVALLNAAKTLLDKKKYAEAERYILEVLRRDMNDPAAFALLAESYVAQGKINEAVTFYMTAVRLNPAELYYKERFIELGGAQHVAAHEELTDIALVECLKTPELDCSRMQPLWVSHVTAHPGFQAAYQLGLRKNFDPANKDFFDNISDFKPLFTPCFLLGLRNLIVPNPVFEEFITHVRKHLLGDYGQNAKFSPEESVRLAEALAHYAFHTDYILDVTGEEQEKIESLRTRIETDEKMAADAAAVALFACYAPLYKLKNAAQVERNFSSSPEMAGLIKEQVTDYHALQAATASLTAITGIDDAVSVKVREQYEEFPYPRWKKMSRDSVIRGWEQAGRNEEIAGALRRKKGAQILIAGCGTGQESCMLAMLFPEAEILAVDLSRSSLAYAVLKAREHGITNVTFGQADILQLGALEKKFDYIMSGGVLHHMKDPVQGWKVLCGLLKPDGLMSIGLYSKIARREIIKTCEVIRQGNYASDAAGMKRFRRDGARLLAGVELNWLYDCKDYYSLNMYRDLLFHAQEHNFGLPEIKSILEDLKLGFVGFSLPREVLAEYGRLYPEDRSQTDLQNWHLFEEKNPTLFKQMYIFWCRKEP